MKNEEIKKAFETNFKKEAPADFTKNLMSKVQASQYKYERLIPNSVFWVIGCASACLFLSVLIFQPNISLPFSFESLGKTFSEIVHIIMVPMVVLTLLFIKNVYQFVKMNSV